MLAVVGIPSREPRPPGSGEVSLSPELRTAGWLRPHVWVGYQWSHTGFRLGRKASRNRSIRSLVSQSPNNRMLQVYKNTNAPPENGPDFSTQVSAALGFMNLEFFSKSCSAGCRFGINGWFVTIMMGPGPQAGGRPSPRERGS